MIDKKGAAILWVVIGLVVVAIIGSVVYYSYSGKSSSSQVYNGSSGGNNALANGASGGAGGSGSFGSGSSGDVSSWCTSSLGNVGTVVGVETFRGVQTCHTTLSAGPTTIDRYVITPSKEWWDVDNYGSSQGGYILEYHYVNGKCAEYSCSKNPGQVKLQCEQISSAACHGGVEVN